MLFFACLLLTVMICLTLKYTQLSLESKLKGEFISLVNSAVDVMHSSVSDSICLEYHCSLICIILSYCAFNYTVAEYIASLKYYNSFALNNEGEGLTLLATF